MLHNIMPLIPEHDLYTESFFGGGAVFWRKVPAANETINDKSSAVINFYEVLKTRYSELKPLIDSTLVSRSQHHKAMRVVFDESHDHVERAWAFWFTTNCSFTHKIGGGLKYGRDTKTIHPKILHRKKERFTEMLVERIENVIIECGDAINVIQTRDTPNAFHYVDPP